MCNTTRFLAYAAILCCAVSTAFGQRWVDLLYSPDPNLFEVSKAYEEYWSGRPFVKSRETQDYKRWVRMMEDFADANGNFRRPAFTPAEQDRFWQERLHPRSSERTQSSTAWKSIGPFSWDKTAKGLSYAPGQAHCYTVEQGTNDTSVVYVGTATAGLWKSTNSGSTWTNVTASMMVREVRSILVDPRNASNVYMGCSLGVLHSVDGGTTWTETSIKESFYNGLVVWDMIMHPDEPAKVHVVTNRGLYYSTDAGATFTRLMSGEFYELERHPAKPAIVYTVKHTGDSCEFYKSTNGGLDFTKSGKGLPVPNVARGEHTRRWEIAVTQAATQNVYCFAPGNIDSSDGTVGMYVSTDEGQTFSMRCCGTAPGGKPDSVNVNMMCWDAKGLELGGQYYYDLGLNVSPTDANRIYVCGINVWISTDGGRSFKCNAHWTYGDASKPRYVHADCHNIKIYGDRVWVVSDGGVWLSTDQGASFTDMTRGIQGTEFWGWGAGFSDCDVMLGGTYHNGVLMKDGDTYDGWLHIYGGDNDGGMVNFGDARTVYANTYMGQTWHRVTLSGVATKDLGRQDMNIKPTSPMIQHPRCNSELWVGTDSVLARSTNNGRSWSSVTVVPKNQIRLVRMCDTDPKTIVIMFKSGYYGNATLRRSTDGGTTWTEITPPAAMLKGNGWRIADVAIDARDAKVMWCSIGGNQTDVKVLRSMDGGATWENYSGSLNVIACRALVHQRGTDHGVYLGTDAAVYYRDASMSDWKLYSDSMPVASVTTFDICYREQKIRAATNRGIFEAPLYTSAPPVAVIACDRYVTMCTRDTIYFHDHSSADESTVRRQWSFPGAWIDTSSSAHPRVVYPAPGIYRVTLTVSDAFGMDSHRIDSCVTVLSSCTPDSVPGAALLTDGKAAYASIPPLLKTSVETTIMAWIKRKGQQSAYSGLVMSRGSGTVAGLSIEADNTLRYHWNGDAWWLKGTLVVPDNEWTHVALVITPDSSFMYVNGKRDAFAFTHPLQTFESETMIGQDPFGGRFFNGAIDEVRIYDRAMPIEEIRADMHLTNRSAYKLLAYYQFNESAGDVIDVAGTRHATMSTTASRTKSTAPIGPGTSARTVTTMASTELDMLDLTLTWAQSAPLLSNEMVLSKIRLAPQPIPANINQTRGGYYILRSFGADTYESPNQITFNNILVQKSEGANAATLTLFRRSANSDGTWGTRIASAVEAVAGYQGIVRFFGGGYFTTSTQFVLATSAPPVSVDETVAPSSDLSIRPNPARTTAMIEHGDDATVRIYSLVGEVMFQSRAEGPIVVDVSAWPTGTYYVRSERKGVITVDQLVVRE